MTQSIYFSYNNVAKNFLKPILLAGTVILVLFLLAQVLQTFYLQSTINQMNQEILRGKAPSGITRVDDARIPHEKPHVHIGDVALNKDGTWKHGKMTLTNQQKEWLEKHNWKVPDE